MSLSGTRPGSSKSSNPGPSTTHSLTGSPIDTDAARTHGTTTTTTARTSFTSHLPDQHQQNNDDRQYAMHTPLPQIALELGDAEFYFGESSLDEDGNEDANASVIDWKAGRRYRDVVEDAQGGHEVEGARLDDVEDEEEFRIEEMKVSDTRGFISKPATNTKIAPVVTGLEWKEVLETSKSALTEKTFVNEVSPLSTNASDAYTNVDVDANSELGIVRGMDSQTDSAIAATASEHERQMWTYTMDNKPTWKKVTLVLVCTMGMIINVRPFFSL